MTPQKLLNLLITCQQVIPFRLPNEWLSWHRYNQQFSKTCDKCHDDRGSYQLTYQDPQLPATVVYPFAVRLCTACLCDAEDAVGAMSNTPGDDDRFKIERQ